MKIDVECYRGDTGEEIEAALDASETRDLRSDLAEQKVVQGVSRLLDVEVTAY